MHKVWKIVFRNTTYRYYIIIITAILVLMKCKYNAVSSETDKVNELIEVVTADFIHENLPAETEKVTLQLFYETLCPSCIQFDPQFARMAIKLYKYLNIYTYPYGNAEIINNEDGSVEVECQHGELECYGNKLHACAIDILKDAKLYLEYNACMMPLNSNDTAAEKCGKDMKIPIRTVRAIKKCAKSPKGLQLLVYYGEESRKRNLPYVPYVLIDEAEWNGEDLTKVVCALLSSPPSLCQEYI